MSILQEHTTPKDARLENSTMSFKDLGQNLQSQHSKMAKPHCPVEMQPVLGSLTLQPGGNTLSQTKVGDG